VFFDATVFSVNKDLYKCLISWMSYRFCLAVCLSVVSLSILSVSVRRCFRYNILHYDNTFAIIYKFAYTNSMAEDDCAVIDR